MQDTSRCEVLCLDDLTEKQREVVLLLLDERSTKEIARIIGISPSAVEQRLKTIRHRYGDISRRELQRRYRAAEANDSNPLYHKTMQQIPAESSTPKRYIAEYDNDLKWDDFVDLEPSYSHGIAMGMVIGAMILCTALVATIAILVYIM